jgi:hypothetical protein
VPDVKEIRELILRDAHDSTYSIHPGCKKMYQDLNTHFWWHGMKRDVAKYVAFCDTCQRVKVEHQRPTGLLTTENSRVDVGRNRHGFYSWAATYSVQV